MFIAPDQYRATPVRDLLDAAARGHAGLDHRLLDAIVTRAEEAIPELVRRGLESGAGDRVDLTEDLIHMLRHLATPQALPFFIELLRDDSRPAPEHLGEAIVALGAAAVEPLLDLYRELDEEQQSEAAFLLASLRSGDPRVLALLAGRHEQGSWDGAFCLGISGDPAARAVLEGALARNPEDEDARLALRDLDTRNPPAPPFDLWALYPPVASPDFDVLPPAERLALLDSATEENRVAAAASFFHEELSGPAADRLFDAARKDPSAKVRARAWEALSGELERPEILEALLARLDDSGAPLEERCGALVAVSHRDEAPVRDRIVEFYGIPEARAKALEAMWRSLDRRYGRYFPPHLDDPDPEVCREAIRGAGFCELHATVGRLRELWDHDDLRIDALFAYAMAAPGQTTPAHLRALLARIDRETGGLDEGEEQIVKTALDERLRLHGLDPVFFPDPPEEEPQAPPHAAAGKIGRNDPCSCGSGKKYKKCCGA